MTNGLEEHALSMSAEVAEKLLAASKAGGNEADFRRKVTRILEQAGEVAGMQIEPQDEYVIASGRADSLYNKIVIEYKAPGILKDHNSASANQKAIEKIKSYISDVAEQKKQETNRMAGVITDGGYYIFVRRVGRGWMTEDPMPVNKSSTEIFLRTFFSLAEGVALIPENLVSDFGPRTGRAQEAVRALYYTLVGSKNPLVKKLFEQWKTFFSEATEYQEWADRIESKKEFHSFVDGMGISIKDAKAHEVFFAIHSYYALLIKLIASLVASKFAGGATSFLYRTAGQEGEELKESFVELERGGLFPNYGVYNFLEGDFFGWYIPAWNKQIEKALHILVQRLSEYDPSTIDLAPENARDLLKKLYHFLLPRDIRHDLGEYYTPDWLAERLIIQTLGSRLGDPSLRVLDPACGSGTFLVLIIKHIKQSLKKRQVDPADVLELILNNVIGFDLNPLAVIAARTNYLLALGDLWKYRKGNISIPVYQADSVVTPTQGDELFNHNVFHLRTSAGVFRVPKIFATRERMDLLTKTLDQCVEDNLKTDSFLFHVHRQMTIPDSEKEETDKELSDLYHQLSELHRQGLNGVWARIIKNAFAPLFIEPCDFIIGNPPWINWESLPEDYRQGTKKIWQHYGLFPHGGMDTILGKGKKDISMLMTYVAADKYLKMGGKIGFVLSQSLFKASGAGQGFRKFMLPRGIFLRPLIVEDMVNLNPFEGATNRTVVAIFDKGKALSYPVPYSYWKKTSSGKGSSIGFDTPYEEVSKDKITFHSWHAKPVNEYDSSSPWIAGRKKALSALSKVLGKSYYSAHAGSFTGGANSIYWVQITGERPDGLVLAFNISEGAKKKTRSSQVALEPGIMFPLLRGRDVEKWSAIPSAHIIMTQDPKTRKGFSEEMMVDKFPNALHYLARNEKALRARAAFKRYFDADDPYWSMFNVSEFTFSDWKVVWREQASEFTAAVIGKYDRRPIIPDHKLMMVEARSSQEAHFICAMLNSLPVRLVVASYAINIQMNTHILKNVRIPKFSEKNGLHGKLAALSAKGHEFASKKKYEELKETESEIDHLAAQLWEVSSAEFIEMKKSLDEM